MKCPKCGYHSFDYLENCKKCGIDLAAHKSKYNLRGFFAPSQVAAASVADIDEPAAAPAVAAAPEKAGGDVDFGFDFLEEDEEQVAGSIDLGDDDQDLNLDKPFDIDAESVPADLQAGAGKKDPGSEFSF